jgi:hypothetical protein
MFKLYTTQGIFTIKYEDEYSNAEYKKGLIKKRDKFFEDFENFKEKLSLERR